MNEEIYLTVSDVNNYLKTIFDRDEFLNYVNIKGEISNLKVHSRGHLYFSLKDENSKINAVMFNYKDAFLPFTPEDGMNVEVKGRVGVYVAGGSYQITVTSMKQDGIGSLFILFEELKKKLNSEGLFDPEKKKKIPRIPKKVGVITAPTGAAVKDIISTINRRFPLTEILLFPTLVQGDGAKDNIVRMLRLADTTDVDVIILGRGGGSIEDLWAFNEEVVARQISIMNKPVVSAVGHEIDYTISDFVSDLRAPTPTGAAELVVPSKLEIIRYLNDYKGRIINVMNKKITNYEETLYNLKTSYVLKNPSSMYNIEEQKLDNYLEKVNLIIKNKLEKYETRLETIKTKLELLNPENILKKGYSITLVDGKIVKSTKEIKNSTQITTRLKDGNIISTINEIKEV